VARVRVTDCVQSGPTGWPQDAEEDAWCLHQDRSAGTIASSILAPGAFTPLPAKRRKPREHELSVQHQEGLPVLSVGAMPVQHEQSVRLA
jgi:hypothetical protein